MLRLRVSMWQGGLPKNVSDALQVGSVESNALPSTAALTLVVTSSTFDPERHAALLTVSELAGGGCSAVLFFHLTALRSCWSAYTSTPALRSRSPRASWLCSPRVMPPPPRPARYCDTRAGKYSGNAGQQFDVTQHDERAAAAAAPVSTLVQVMAGLRARRAAATLRVAEVPRPRVRSSVDRRTAEEASGGKRAPAVHIAPLLQSR